MMHGSSGLGWSWRTGSLLMSLCGLLAGGCAATATAGSDEEWIARGRRGIVASDSECASQAGARILREGGNAIDAAAATSLALGVTRPYSAGLGGGGFLMVRFARTGEVFVLDYRERAPGAATPDMYVQARAQRPDAPPPSRYGGLAAGTPGLLAGHSLLLQRFGTRSLHQVVQPAFELAAEGFPVDSHYLGAVRGTLRDLDRYPQLAAASAFLRERLLFGGAVPEVGTILRQPEMANTLREIGRHGPDHFYRGPIAEAIAATVQAHGGIMTADDLARYKPSWRTPLRVRYRNQFEILLMPPASSGGICLAQTLNILEHWDLRQTQREDPGLAAHLTVEALKHAFADRARHLGDADFVPVPIERLTSKAYASELAARIRENGVSDASDYGWTLNDDAGTTHYCVVDRWGNVVSATETINTTFGSLVADPQTGIVLNDEMDDFTAEPGEVNVFGLRQSELNQVEPYKRPLSSMSPSIVLANGSPVLAVGASGGPRIITATLQVMLHVIEYGLPLEQAIGAPRLHHQWQPDEVYRNNFAADDPVIVGLQRRGHAISPASRGAVVQAVQIQTLPGPGRTGSLIGASDPRKGGRPAGL